MKTIAFAINSGIPDAAIYRTIAELKRINVGANVTRQETSRILMIKFPNNTTTDSIVYICQVTLNTLLS